MKTRPILRQILAVGATLILATAANAQLFRAYLASDGSDANPCNLAQPCRLLPAALNAVADGGEIWMLDSANYNGATVTIGKSVSILAVPGVVGSVVATGGPAVSITAASLKVALRNLVIVPLAGGGGTDGVLMTGASTLTIEGSLIANLPHHGVAVTGNGTLKIANSVLRNNGYFAVFVANGVQAEISGSQMLVNGQGGVTAYGSTTSTTTTVSVSDSIVSGGGQAGIHAYTTNSGATTKVFVTRCTIEGVSLALDSETSGVGTAVVAVSSSTVVNNYFGWYQSGAGSVIRTLGNNHITDNTTSTGSLTPTALQ
jgi:hypothetical protein